MEKGYLQVSVTAGGVLPVAGARVLIFDKKGNTLFDAFTDADGQSPVFSLDAPPAALTLQPDTARDAYANYDAAVFKEGFNDKIIYNTEIVAGESAVLPVELEPVVRGAAEKTQEITITPPLAVEETGPQLQEGTENPPASRLARVLPNVIIPEYITVHLGTPSSSAQNVRVRFTDYVKNVTSSEIYPTWPENSIIANIHVIVTYALNRVYTEWYPSRGYAFDITNSTAYDQYYVHGRDIFTNISRLVDRYFDVYAHRSGYKNPFFTQYCNGTTSTCRGLSQWGTVGLANSGYSPLRILRYYYGGDIVLDDAPVSSVTTSYPGTALKLGSSGAAVSTLQKQLTRIRKNYTGIPAITDPDGYYGASTEAAVKAFQKIFSLTQDGITGKATWNKVSQIYVGVTNLAELDSEGEKEGAGGAPPSNVIKRGSSGALVTELQTLLNFASRYYDSVPAVTVDGSFGPATENAVKAFQKTFGLTQDGVVGAATWGKLYDVYNSANQTAPPYAPSYPGFSFSQGARGDYVTTIQRYLTNLGYGLTADGIFGPATDRAVRSFQSSRGLSADGIVGPKTWNAIIIEGGRGK